MHTTSNTQATASSATDPRLLAAPEVIHPAFECLRRQHVATLNVVLEEYRHKLTGAQYFHLASDDVENVFIVALRTVPMDSTGVAHILEHTVLCGSERFPVRDPFFMMIRRSLNTFMNAFTSSDWTAYPFASKNRKDFNNLLEVYLDAVFFSRLHELDFAQEGHRLEFAEMANPQSDLQYKGVVFNEMKGAMSSTSAILWQTICKYLYPSTTYHYNSGGEPDHIPDLSYADLKDFYRTHYHPSNAVFMTYGDIPAYEHQARFHELALARFEKLDTHIHVRDEKRYFAPLRVEENYPILEEEGEEDAGEESSQNKTHVVLAWLLGKSIDMDEMFQAQLLSSVLLDNSASPLMHVLETCGLGSAPSPMCGLEDGNREMSFMCGLEGCARDSTAEVEALIRSTLEKIAQEGVPEEQVHAALHQLELQQREITGDSHPYGLQLIIASLSSTLHGGDPLSVLDIDPALAKLREQIAQPNFIGQLIQKLLLDNQHHLVLTLQPDTLLAQRQANAELERLQAIKAALTPAQTQQIVRQSQLLAERQEAQDDPSLLPKVGLEDVPAGLSEVTYQRSEIAGSKMPASFYPQGTNGICYEQLVIELPHLEDELLAVLPYYTSILPEFGVGSRGYAEVQTWQSRISGGVNCYANIHSQVDDEQHIKAIMVLSSKALLANHAALDELLYETFMDVRFDEVQRLREIMDQISARRESSITGQGHVLAMSLASSGMSPTAQLSHRYTGLEGIGTLRSLSKSLKKDADAKALLEKFRALHERIKAAPRQILLVGEEAAQASLLHSLEQQWQAPIASSAHFTPLSLPQCRKQVRQIWSTNTQVNFCAKAYPTVAAAHPDHATLGVLAGFLRNGFLHRSIREQGGAYGGGADQDANSASFRFYSYRDPRLVETLKDFERAIEWVLGNSHEERQVEEAILGVIGSMDKSSSPAGEAKQAFYNALFGRSREQRQRYREQVLGTNLADLQRVAEQYLLQPESASVGVISNAAQVAQVKELGLEERSI